MKNSIILVFSLILISCGTSTQPERAKNHLEVSKWQSPDINDMSLFSIENLRTRNYGGKFQIETEIENNSNGYQSYILSYLSDGLLNYARLDVPEQLPPNDGYSILLYSHGWVGEQNAASFNFFLDQKGSQAKYIDHFATQGYLVITPGWRGHGTVDGKQAQGIEYLQKWDNATYLSPIFYAIDMLNALDSLPSLSGMHTKKGKLSVNLNHIVLAGHSQGGDAALLAMAIAGENSKVQQNLSAVSIFAGCILPRLEQGYLYGPMASTAEAFMSGDGTWTASHEGKDGTINPNFLFAYPPDWIGTVNRELWTWQQETWSTNTVEQALLVKYEEMYEILKSRGITYDTFELTEDELGKINILHPENIVDGYANTDPINFPFYLTEPLSLHFSDQDYYSPDTSNFKLANTLKSQNEQVSTFLYKGNTHSLTKSAHKWFSPDWVQPGIDLMIKRDLEKFQKIKFDN